MYFLLRKPNHLPHLSVKITVREVWLDSVHGERKGGTEKWLVIGLKIQHQAPNALVWVLLLNCIAKGQNSWNLISFSLIVKFSAKIETHHQPYASGGFEFCYQVAIFSQSFKVNNFRDSFVSNLCVARHHPPPSLLQSYPTAIPTTETG